MKIQGAGGTPGGVGSFVIGFLMMCTGFYLLMQSVIVTRSFGLGMGLFHFAFFGGPVTVTSGMILIPLIFGIGMIFFNARGVAGWVLAIGSLAALIAGVAPLFGFTAIKLGFVGYVTAIFKLSTVASVVWAALLLKETGFKERIAGSATMVLGAILISL